MTTEDMFEGNRALAEAEKFRRLKKALEEQQAIHIKTGNTYYSEYALSTEELHMILEWFDSKIDTAEALFESL